MRQKALWIQLILDKNEKHYFYLITSIGKKMKKFGCEGCELFGNDCDGLSRYCDCGVIKEKK